MIANYISSDKEFQRCYGAALSINAVYEKKLLAESIEIYKSQGFDRVYFFEDKELDTQVIMMTNETDILITIPGTVGQQDMLTDASFAYWLYKRTLKRRNLTADQENKVKRDMKRAVKDGLKKKIGLPHFGFYFSAWRIFQKNEVLDVLDREGVASKTLTITGHSLGGALTQMFSYLLSAQGVEPDNIYTFGSPAPARKKFHKLFNRRFPQALAFIHESDIVPYLAPRFAFFKRCGKEMFIDIHDKIEAGHVKLFDKRRFKGRRGNKKFDLFADHKMPEYVHGLKANI